LRSEELDTFQGLSSEILNVCVQPYPLQARNLTRELGVSQSAIRDFCHSRNLEASQGLGNSIIGLSTQYSEIFKLLITHYELRGYTVPCKEL
jgi:hypothetical protein